MLHSLSSHDIVTFSHILLAHYCHMMNSHWTILVVTLLSQDIIPFSTVICVTYVLPYSTDSCCTYIVPYSNVICHTYIVPYSMVTRYNYIVPYSTVTWGTYIVPYSTVTWGTYIVPYSTVTWRTYIVPYSTLIYCTYIVSYATVTCCTYIVLYSTVTRLIDFCGINNFVILCSHKEIHKLTWISPNQRDKKEIDHILITGKWQRSLQDVRFRRGVDVGSNHHLVVTHIKLKLKRTVTPIRLFKWFDVSKLKDAGIRPVVQY